MRTEIISFMFFIFNVNLLFGQVYILVPNKGIKEVPVVVDSTNISDVIELFGDDYYYKDGTYTSYKYEKFGLTFEIDSYDKNQIIRSIIMEAPFQARTENGIVLNESTMNDVWSLYNSKGCFMLGNSACYQGNGISFFIKRNIKEKGYDPNEKIYKIEINNKGKSGVFSRVNFEFNRQPIEEKLSELLTILKADVIDTLKLHLFWKEEEKRETKPYGLKKKTEFKRKIENNFIQEYIEVNIATSFYHLNIIKSDENIIYLKLLELELINGNDSILFERNDKKIDWFDLDVYIYGTFCSVSGLPPEKCIEMLELVRENNYNQLAKWIKTINPELATYGYIGLKFLERKGIKLQLTELKRMKELEKSDVQLNTCEGCILGITKKISDIVKKQNLKQTYFDFKQHGWLK